MTTQVAGLSTLAAKLDAARAEMSAAKERVFALEQELVEVTGFAKLDGSETFEDPEDGTKVVLKQPLYHYVDEAAWRAIEVDAPPIVRDCIRWKADVAKVAMRRLEKENADMWSYLAAECITTRPGKVQVEVKR